MSETLESQLERLQKQHFPATPATGCRVEDYTHQTRVNLLRENWNAPRRHTERKDIDRSGEFGRMDKWISEQCGKGYFIALVGKRGPGKTQLAVEAMKNHTEQLKSARYITATAFLMRVKGTYKAQEREDEDDVLTLFAKPSLLVIDEYSKRGETDWEDRLLFELLDRRYNAIKDTIIVSNHGKAEFVTAIGQSLASRMNEAGGIVECEWESFR